MMRRVASVGYLAYPDGGGQRVRRKPACRATVGKAIRGITRGAYSSSASSYCFVVFVLLLVVAVFVVRRPGPFFLKKGGGGSSYY
jgi:hypothetical protein